jgi:hypothetical protein
MKFFTPSLHPPNILLLTVKEYAGLIASRHHTTGRTDAHSDDTREKVLTRRLNGKLTIRRRAKSPKIDVVVRPRGEIEDRCRTEATGQRDSGKKYWIFARAELV